MEQLSAPPACLPHIRRLRFNDIAQGGAYHAALIAVDGARARGFQTTTHTHDYYELMCVLAGEAAHGVNGAADAPLRAGELILLRPGDWHFVRFQTGRLLHYINIAVSAELWRGFAALTGADAVLNAPSVHPTVAALAPAAADECVQGFRRALEQFQAGDDNGAGRVEACRLLASVTPWLARSARGDSGDADNGLFLGDDAPLWLVRACRDLRHDSEVLRQGLPAFVERAQVTRTHLARVLKSATGQTPTEYIASVRVERAARLLTTTTLPLLDIAAECGFDQPSYFYRRFRARFGAPPHAYRVAAARRVAPEPSAKKG